MNAPEVLALADWLEAKSATIEAIVYGPGSPEGQAIGLSVELLGMRGKAYELRALARSATSEGGGR